MRCDLHVHTCRSDGAHTPAEVMRRALEGGIELLSLTDHDTVDAYDELESVATPILLHGVEITTATDDGEELHMLGYFPFGFSSGIRAFLTEVQEERRERMRVALERLGERGIHLSFEALQASCEGPVISRSHLAQAMVDKGLVDSYGGAFRRYIGSRHDIVPRPSIRPEQAIDMIRRERGISVWAHPRLSRLQRELGRLVSAGLNGIEVYHRSRKDHELAPTEALADAHRLLRTGGSDWHGHHPGDQLGQYTIPSQSIRPLLSFFDLPEPEATR